MYGYALWIPISVTAIQSVVVPSQELHDIALLRVAENTLERLGALSQGSLINDGTHSINKHMECNRSVLQWIGDQWYGI